MTQAPAGWYPDATSPRPGVLRNWDGQAWTEHVHALPATGPTTPDGVPLARWRQRLGAYLIDVLIIYMVGGPISLPLWLAFQHRWSRFAANMPVKYRGEPPPRVVEFGYSAFVTMLEVSGVYLALWLIYEFVMLRLRQQTVGKRALGLQVRHIDNPSLSTGNIMERIAVQFLVGTVVPFFPLVDGLCPLWNRKRQALHDMAASTVVVKTE